MHVIAAMISLIWNDERCGTSIGTVHIASVEASALFDPGATHSFVSLMCASRAGLVMVPLEEECYVSTPCAGVMVVFTSCPYVTVSVGDQEMMTDLLVLDMRDFDVILGMDWLASYHATVDCFSKEVYWSVGCRGPTDK